MAPLQTTESRDNLRWFKLSGIDYGTGYEFGDVWYAVDDGRVLRDDGTILSAGDLEEIAVRNALAVFLGQQQSDKDT